MTSPEFSSPCRSAGRRDRHHPARHELRGDVLQGYSLPSAASHQVPLGRRGSRCPNDASRVSRSRLEACQRQGARAGVDSVAFRRRGVPMPFASSSCAAAYSGERLRSDENEASVINARDFSSRSVMSIQRQPKLKKVRPRSGPKEPSINSESKQSFSPSH